MFEGATLILGAIADDVTGASDLCSALSRAGMRTIQTFGPAPGLGTSDVDAIVVALKSRSSPRADAVAASTGALTWLQGVGAQQIFFKYCSTFDSTPVGNIGPVADALMDALGAQVTVVCPAYPKNGRTVYQGHLFVGDRLLSESSMARHPLTPMTDSDLVRVLSDQTRRRVGLVPYSTVRRGAEAIKGRLGELADAGVSYGITDALQVRHLRSIGTACAGLPLVTGGSGLAFGLAQHLLGQGQFGSKGVQPRARVAPGPALVLAGSCSAATQQQVKRMSSRYPAVRLRVLEVAEGTGVIDSVTEQAAGLLRRGPVLVYTTAGPEEVSRTQQALGTARASEVAESSLGEIARRLDIPRL